VVQILIHIKRLPGKEIVYMDRGRYANDRRSTNDYFALIRGHMISCKSNKWTWKVCCMECAVSTHHRQFG